MRGYVQNKCTQRETTVLFLCLVCTFANFPSIKFPEISLILTKISTPISIYNSSQTDHSTSLPTSYKLDLNVLKYRIQFFCFWFLICKRSQLECI